MPTIDDLDDSLAPDLFQKGVLIICASIECTNKISNYYRLNVHIINYFAFYLVLSYFSKNKTVFKYTWPLIINYWSDKNKLLNLKIYDISRKMCKINGNITFIFYKFGVRFDEN